MDQLLLRRSWWFGFLGFAFLLDGSLAWTRWLFLFFLAPVVADVLHVARRAGGATEREDGPDDGSVDGSVDRAPELPLPGPAAADGPFFFGLRCTISDALALLHPRQRRQVIRQARGERRARERVGQWDPTPGDFVPRVEYDLPFEGEWYVAGDGAWYAAGASGSRQLRAHRWALDLVVVGVDGRTHAGDGSRLEHYHAYGRAVLAPADGQVVEVVGGVRDAPWVGTGWLDWRAPEIGGNSITIRHADGEFSHLAHLAPGSIGVRAGEWVRRGQPIARCGNSGHSTEPHLRFQLQDHPDCYQAVGLPALFCRIRVNGDPLPRTLHLERGMRVSSSSGDRPSATLLAAIENDRA